MRLSACVIGLCLAAAAPAAAHPTDWSALANTVFRPIARMRDLQTPTAPLAFAEDQAGFLWAGGESGLLRWDGYQFRSYTPATSPHDGLRNHYVWALHTDRGGHLWAGTDSGGLARYDDATDQFISVPLADARGEALCVWSLDDDGAGGLWAGTNRGVAHVDARGQVMHVDARGEVVPLDARGHSLPQSIASAASPVFIVPDRKVEAVAWSRQNRLWIGGADGLAWIGPDGHANPVTLPTTDGTTPQVSRLMQDGAGRVWAGTRHHGAYVVDLATLQARAVPMPASTAQDRGLEIMAMAEVQPGRIWLGTFGQGIIDVTAATLTSRAIVHDPVVPGSPSANIVYGLHRDRSGITWVSTVAALDQFVPPAGGVLTLFGIPGRPDGLPTDVTAVLSRRDGTLWLGSQADGIIILDAEGRKVRTLKVPRVFCLAEAADGPVYIGTRSG